MSLTASQIDLIKKSYQAIRLKKENYSSLFYHRLLLRHPFTRALFRDDMRHQVEVFHRTLDALVDNVENLPELQPTLAALARRHVGYGVQVHHYDIVGTVLIDTFAEMLRGDFTPETRQAWEAVYAATAGVMIDAAYPDR